MEVFPSSHIWPEPEVPRREKTLPASYIFSTPGTTLLYSVNPSVQVPSGRCTFLKLVFILPDLPWLSGSCYCSLLLLLVNSGPYRDYGGVAFYRRYTGDFPILECFSIPFYPSCLPLPLLWAVVHQQPSSHLRLLFAHYFTLRHGAARPLPHAETAYVFLCWSMSFSSVHAIKKHREK